jgi:hypothetical protein
MKEYIILGKDTVGYYPISKVILGVLVQDASGTRITSDVPSDIIVTVPSECLVIETKYSINYF